MKKAQALKLSLKTIRDIPGRLPKRQAEWDAAARNVLQEDLGMFDDSVCHDYGLDETTRDRLIAHARQDAALAYYAAAKAEGEARSARIWSWFSLLVLCLVLYKVW